MSGFLVVLDHSGRGDMRVRQRVRRRRRRKRRVEKEDGGEQEIERSERGNSCHNVPPTRQGFCHLSILLPQWDKIMKWMASYHGPKPLPHEVGSEQASE